MKLGMRIGGTIFLVVAGFTALGYFFWYKPKFKFRKEDHPFSFRKKADDNTAFLRLKEKAGLLSAYANDNGFNTTRCFLADMRIASGKKRFFVYNLQKDSVEQAGLVAHGSGSDKGTADLIFSNTPNSNCTSLGKYRIGKSYMGTFGLAYKLYGLDNTNSKAFERFVVLHAHACVPNGEVAPLPICESWGCPTVAPAFLKELQTIIDRSEKPVLLWIYY